MQSDADRLAMIKSLGGQLVRHPDGSFWAIHDCPSVLANGVVRTRQSTLEARAIDVEALAKDTPLSVGDLEYRIKDQEPDGTGMSVVILRR